VSIAFGVSVRNGFKFVSGLVLAWASALVSALVSGLGYIGTYHCAYCFTPTCTFSAPVWAGLG